MQQQEVRILARPQMNPSKCDFEVDRDVFPGVIFFPERASAAGSPLAEKLFALEGVQHVLVRGPLVTVTKAEEASWADLAKAVGAAIRAQVQSGEPAIRQGAGGGTAHDEEIRTRVLEVVEKEINPMVASHGGFIEISGVKGGIVYLRMGGGCQGCASSTATLRMGVERAIRTKVPEVLEVLDVTDHAAGETPYFQ